MVGLSLQVTLRMRCCVPFYLFLRFAYLYGLFCLYCMVSGPLCTDRKVVSGVDGWAFFCLRVTISNPITEHACVISTPRSFFSSQEQRTLNTLYFYRCL